MKKLLLSALAALALTFAGTQCADKPRSVVQTVDRLCGAGALASGLVGTGCFLSNKYATNPIATPEKLERYTWLSAYVFGGCIATIIAANIIHAIVQKIKQSPDGFAGYVKNPRRYLTFAALAGVGCGGLYLASQDRTMDGFKQTLANISIKDRLAAAAAVCASTEALVQLHSIKSSKA